MSDLRKFFGSTPSTASLSSPSADSFPSKATKSAKRKQPDQDESLQKALELSKKQVKLETMDEEEQLAEAIRRSNEAGPLPEVFSTSLTKASTPAQVKKEDVEAPEESDEKKVTVAPLFESVGSPSDFSTFDSRYLTERPPKIINKLEGSLDLLYLPGWIGKEGARKLFQWMLAELNWHRVAYIRPGFGTHITTPRYTTTFGRDDTKAPDSSYKIKPTKIPAMLEAVKAEVEKLTGTTYNSLIINYYADGKDSISYHSDDEKFLGDNPSIASISLGSSRDFYLRRKAPAGVEIPKSNKAGGTKGSGPAASRPTEKFFLSDGDLLLMRGRTQAEWEHSIPKRAKVDGGRINITFRTVLNAKGTENFQKYNRGDNPPFRFRNGKMVPGSGGL